MEYLQETSLGDILKIIDAFSEVIKTKGEDKNDKLWNILKGSTTKSQYRGSITSQANKLCMTFPVLCSNSISPSTASMISKAIERKMIILVQQLFAADILTTNAGSGGLESIINRIYKGIDFDTLSVDDLIDITQRIDPNNRIFSESAIHTGQYSEEIKSLVKKIMNSPVYESSVSDSPISAYMVDTKYGAIKEDPEMVLTEAISRSNKAKINKMIDDYMEEHPEFHLDKESAQKLFFGAQNIYTNSTGKDFTKMEDLENVIRMSKEIRDRLGDARDEILFKQQLDNMIQDFDYKAAKNRRENRADKRAEEEFINKQKLDKKREKREKEKLSMERERNKRDAQMQIKQDLIANADLFKKQLLDTDVKKSNELTPSMLVVNYGIDRGKETLTTSGIVGIKTRLIPVDPFQILDKLASKNKDKNGFIKFIRATTGEIKFLKDFVLAIDKAKIDAINKYKRGSDNPMWRVLERRAAVHNLRKALGKDDPSPLTTLVISQEEVEYLKKVSDMELDNVNTANMIINAFNLIGICIVDETMETAKFLFDGEFNQFDTYAFTSLQKENNDSSMYKKVINLMAKKM